MPGELLHLAVQLQLQVELLAVLRQPGPVVGRLCDGEVVLQVIFIVPLPGIAGRPEVLGSKAGQEIMLSLIERKL